MTRRIRDLHESGSTVVEAAVVIPIAMMVLLLAVQVSLWAHAATLVQGAATVGERAATQLGGSPAAGDAEAQSELTATARKVLVTSSIHAQVVPGGAVEITVSGETESIIPWLRLPVSATRVGLSQGFRASE